MNASRLRELVELLLATDKKYQIQQLVSETAQILGQLISQPQNPSLQSSFSTTLDKLAAAAAQARESFDPAQVPLLQEIGATKYFLNDFPAELNASIRENPLSPAVTNQKITDFMTQRQGYLDHLSQLKGNLEVIGVKATTFDPGDAEIGFLLPRTLFNNRLDVLIKELRDINRIIRAFSEAATGSVETVEVRSISTSDPVFFFHISAVTIAAVAGAVKWALGTWRDVEEIRRVRAETRRTNVLTEKEATDVFDKKINERINAAIDEKVNELAKDDGKPGRAKEQRTDLKWALESILAHVERGMIVEVRFIPPPPPKADDEKAVAAAQPFESLKAIAPELIFPSMQGPPVLKLPQPPPEPDPRNE